MRFLSTLALAATAAASAAFAASLPALSSGKVSISTLDGSSRLSGSFSARSGVSALAADEAVRLDSDELIRVAFNVQGDEEESVGAPPQIVVQLASTADSSRVHSWSTPANKKNGKVTWSQRVDRLPAQTLSTSDGVYSLRLLVAGQQGMDPLALELGQLTIPYLHNAKKSKADDARTARETEMGFRRWEEKRHTFRKEVTEGMPSAKKSVVVGVVLVVVPWLVLVGLVSRRDGGGSVIVSRVCVLTDPNLSLSLSSLRTARTGHHAVLTATLPNLAQTPHVHPIRIAHLPRDHRTAVLQGRLCALQDAAAVWRR